MNDSLKLLRILFLYTIGFIALLACYAPVTKFFSKGISWEVASQFGKLF